MKVYTLPVGQIQMNCYIATTKENHAVIIDPGDETAQLIGKIEQLRTIPVAILLTHGHFDHIGAVKGLMEAYPNIKLYIGQDEFDVVSWSDSYLKQMGFLGVADYIVEHATQLADGEEIIIDNIVLRTMHTPGHTRGGVIYVGNGKIFSGDTVFYEEIGRCDLYTGDYEVMLQSLKKISALSGDYTIYPGHDQMTTLEHERTHNPYFNQ